MQECTGNPEETTDVKTKPEESVVVGSVSRLHPERGIKYFADSIPLILKSSPVKTKFVIVGDGPHRKNLEKRVNKLGIKDKVKFLGARKDMGKIYPTIDILVNPTLNEPGTGNSTAEAMFFEKPVVVSKVGGTPEIVNTGKNGFLVPPKDSKALAGKVLLLLSNEGLRKEMGKEGQKTVENLFNLRRLSDEIEEVYRNLVGKSI